MSLFRKGELVALKGDFFVSTAGGGSKVLEKDRLYRVVEFTPIEQRDYLGQSVLVAEDLETGAWTGLALGWLRRVTPLEILAQQAPD